MPSEARQKKLDRAPKWSILGPQNLGSGGGPGPRGPPPGSASVICVVKEIIRQVKHGKQIWGKIK